MGQVRRVLYTLAVRDYPGAPAAFAEGIDAQLVEVRAWWCTPDLGERGLRAHDLGTVNNREDVEDAVRAAGLRALTANDIAVIYVTGHGTQTNSGQHYLALPAGGPVTHGYRTADLVTAVLASDAEHALVIVNACFAGELLTELAEFRKDLPPHRRRLRSLAVFATADFDERPQVHEFTTLMANVREWLLTRAEYTDKWLSFDDFAAELDRARGRLAELEPAEVLQVWRAGPVEGPSLCLPNPAYRPPDTAVGDARSQVASSAAELDYWLDRASGRVSTSDPGWYFTGRRRLTTQVSQFLASGTGLLLVTGAAGTGKSAIVARAVTLTDPKFLANPRYADAVAAAPTETVPPPNSVAAAVLARNKSTVEVAEQLVVALGGAPVQTTDATRLVAGLREQLDAILRARAGVVVVDGLDEAVDPQSLVVELLGPLLGSTRLVVGVRSATPGASGGGADRGLVELLRHAHDGVAVTELRTDGPDTRDDIEAYLTALLAERYAAALDELTRLSQVVADRIAPSFLDARFAAQRVRDSVELVTTAKPDLLASLNEGTISLLREDITDSATTDHPREDLLAVLQAAAFALGGGIPWADIWPAVASAVRDRQVGDDTVAYVVSGRLSGYLVRDVEDGRVVHRPVHESLAEVLRQAPYRLDESLRDDDSIMPFGVHRSIATALAGLLPASPDVAPHPYLRRHLVGHAMRGAVVDDESVPAALLPWETSGEVRTALGVPIGHARRGSALQAWAGIEPFIGDASPAARALSLDIARANLVVHPPGLRPGWARWRFSGDVLARPPSPAYAIAALPKLKRWALPASDEDTGTMPMLTMWDIIASGEKAGTVRLWNGRDGREVGTLNGHIGEVLALATLTNDNGTELLASGGKDGTIRFWDVVTGRQPRVLHAHSGAVLALCWMRLPDGDAVLASAGEDGEIRVWDPENERPLRSFGGGGAALAVHALAALPNSLLVSGGEDGVLRGWDLLAGREVWTTEHDREGVHLGTVHALAPFPDPPTSFADPFAAFASGSADGTVRVWTADGFLVDTLTGHNGGVRGLAMHNPPELVSGGDDGTIRVWDSLRSDGPIRTLVESTNGIRTLISVLHEELDHEHVVTSVGDDGVIRVWGEWGDNAYPDGPQSPGSLTAVTGVVLRDRLALATVNDGGIVRMWNAETGAEVGKPSPGHRGMMLSLGLVSTGSDVLLAITGVNRSVQLWNPVTGAAVGAPLRRYGLDHAWAPTVAAVSYKQMLLATSDEDGTIRFWEAASGEPIDLVLGGLEGWSGAITAVAPPDGRELFVTGHDKGLVRLWDATTGVPVGRALTGHTDIVRAATTVLMPDGQVFVATGGHDGTVRMWDLATGTERTRIVFGSPVHGLAVTPPYPDTSRYLAVVGPAGITTIEITHD